MAHSFLYLMTILDLASRKVLAWRLSNTVHADFCIEALKEALARFDPPGIFNSDQGAQFTCEEWLEPLEAAGVAISMDGKGCWIDKMCQVKSNQLCSPCGSLNMGLFNSPTRAL